MADSPTRRSSIPILKQTNKTKSFQSYVSLNFTDDQQKSRSPSSLSSMSPPILDNPKLPPRPQARSMTQSVPKLEIDNDIVITKLCDENKRLKEHQTQLVSKYEEGEVMIQFFWRQLENVRNTFVNRLAALRENMEIQNKNDELTKELVQSRREVSEKTQLQRTIERFVEKKLLWRNC